MRPIDQSLWSDCFGFIKNFVFVNVTNISNTYEFVNFSFVTLCDVANISNIYIYIYIYEYVNLVFVTLCDVANISNIYKLVLICL